jgi:Reverse transcriptase (RNA-dependent DNA polymerase)
VTGLGKQRIILGFPWLHKYNLIIDWKKGEITFKPFQIDWRCLMEKGKQIRQEQQPKIEEVADNEEPKNWTTLLLKENKMGVYIESSETDVWIHKTNIATKLAIEENSKKTDKTDEQLVPAEYHKYLDIFSEEKAHHFSESRPWDHKIKIKEGFEPKSFKNYNLTPAEQIKLDKFLNENLEKGYIRPSQSPMASPFFFVSKKDGKLRPCQDYRYLNDWMVKNSYSLPLISGIMDKFKGTKYFTKLDIHWGYNNVRIRKGDEWKAAFKTNKGLFKPTVMFFGMCNSLATFQAMMDDIFMMMIDNQLVIVYMDDILIFADTKEELERITKLVLEKLREHNLFLKAKKCEFCQTRIEYLGMIIEEEKISMDAVKLGGIRNWPVPTKLKQT